MSESMPTEAAEAWADLLVDAAEKVTKGTTIFNDPKPKRKATKRRPRRKSHKGRSCVQSSTR
jgi:hypothetical protein